MEIYISLVYCYHIIRFIHVHSVTHEASIFYIVLVSITMILSSCNSLLSALRLRLFPRLVLILRFDGNIANLLLSKQ